ncbi:hypothetical protein [Nocardioides psychrotolerans]|uniref:hypothetical protein n=1 Tax=Nocardioides psychrotolerans TaxID=1005945 RepID=UPI003138451F
MKQDHRAVVIGVALVLSVLTVLLIAGHGPWAGRTIFEINNRHGLNSGDVPVLVLWAVGMLGCGFLLRKP